ncbi:unnamed protein product [Cunninghamella blakesleeana]
MTNSYWTNTIQQMDPVIQLSLYKLYQLETTTSLDKEHTLRKQVLIRNLLMKHQHHDHDMDMMITHKTSSIHQQQQYLHDKQKEEQSWLDACFDQLSYEDDDIMEETYLSPPPPPPPPPPLPPSYSSSYSTSLTSTSSSTKASTTSSHTVVLAIPSNEQDKFLALLDWSWSSNHTTNTI